MESRFIKYAMILICCFGCIFKMYSQSKQSDVYFAKGIEYFNNNQYEESINSFLSCWNLDSLELSKNDVRRESSRLWLAYLYSNMKNDRVRSSVYSSNNILISPYDRRKTRIADSLLSIACFGNEGVSLENRHESLIESKIEYSKCLGPSNANIGTLLLYEAQFYEAFGQSNNLINSLHKSWEIFCSNYGYCHRSALNTLGLIQKCYPRVDYSINDSIPIVNKYGYRTIGIKNFHFIKRKVGKQKFAYGLVYQSMTDTMLILPAIYRDIEILEDVQCIKLFTRFDDDENEMYQLFDLKKLKFSKESKYFDIVESSKIDASGNVIFKIWSGLLDFDGSLYKYTDSSTVKINKNNVSVRFKDRKKI